MTMQSISIEAMGGAKDTGRHIERRLKQALGRAVTDFGMIDEGDRIMVCLSGGKDSYTLLDLLLALRKKAPVRFELVAVNLDQKQPGFPAGVIPAYLERLGVDYHVIEEDTYRIVREKVPPGKTTCSLCSRLRRGILYAFAEKIGATKIALGHHRDDIVETFFLNMFFNGKLKAMPPKLRSDDGRHVVIRPLAYCREADIARYSVARQHPVIPCNLCGSQDGLQRQEVKKMLAEWEALAPGRSEMILRSLGSVVPSHLMDRQWFDFSGLRAGPGEQA